MSYIGAEPDGMGKAQRFTFTATGTGTAVTADDDGVSIGYTVGQVSVYLNGVKQVIGTGKDVTATDGSTITFLAAYAVDDVIEVVALSIFSATTVEWTSLVGDYVKIPSATTTERDALTPVVGMMLYNTTIGIMQQYASNGWASIDSPPTVSGLDYPGDDTALDIVGEFNLTCTTQSSTTVLAASTTGIVVGQVVKGTGIPTSPVPTVESIITNTSFVLSGAATASASVTLTFNTQTLVITGTNFSAGATVTIDGTVPSTVTRNSSSQITVTGTPTKTAGTKVDGLVVTNTSGLAATINVDYSPLPGWTSPASGNLLNDYTGTITEIALTGGADTTSYAITTGALPAGLTIGSTDGDINGNMTASAATYNFTVTATDAQAQSSPRLFNIISKGALPTGGTLSTYTGYRVHRYLTGSTFVVSASITADILVVGGGAAGGGRWGGGGGSGGVVYAAGTTLIAGTYTIVRGIGGVGVTGTDTQGTGGGNSTFTQTSGGSSVVLTAHGGGGGTAYDAADNQTVRGSSGGTHGHSTAPTGLSSTQTYSGGVSQTYSGGTATNYGNRGGQAGQSGGNGGGGGGAGAVGQDGAHYSHANTQTAGLASTGGAGVQIAWITPQALGYAGTHNGVANTTGFYFAAGGGGSGYSADSTVRYGGAGGVGGGGGGSSADHATVVAGVAGIGGLNASSAGVTNGAGGAAGVNTGSGGGANSNLASSGTSGTGGSGIVIIRYAV